MAGDKNTLLTEKELKEFLRLIERLPPADLETLAQMLWKRKQASYSEWDKQILSYPHKKKP